jgi:hypothetical protein
MSEDAIDAVVWGNPVYGAVFGIRAAALEFLLPIPHPLPGYVLHDGWAAMILGCRRTLRGFDEKLIKYREHPSQRSGLAGRTPPSLAKRLATPARERRAEYRAHVEELKAMFELLSAHKASATFDLNPLAERIRFCEFRLSLPDNLLQRAHLVGREVFRGHYRKHTGRSFQPMVRDVFAL